MAPTPRNVEKCILALTNARTDTERFAALLLVTKVIEAGDCDIEDRRRLFASIGFDFVIRLLLSEEVPAGCPSYVFRSLALSILATFCTVPEFIEDKQMLDNVPVLLEVLGGPGTSEESTAMKNDAVRCLLTLTSSPKSCQILVDNGAVTRLCEIFALDDRVPRLLKEQLFSVISTASGQLGPGVWAHRPDAFHGLVNAISTIMVSEKTQLKFALFEVLVRLFASYPNGASDPRDQSWYHELNEQLLGMLCFKLSDSQRDPLLKLCSAIVDKVGVPWALGANTDKSQRMFFLLVQLCCIEVRMILEDQSLEEVMQKSELASACFLVLEHSIKFLIDDDGHVVSERNQQQMYQALTTSFTAVLGFLSAISSRFCALFSDGPPELERDFVVAVVRVTGAWLAEETAALREEVHALLPFFLQIIVDEKESRGTWHCFRFFLPALCHLSVEDKARSILLEANADELLLRYFTELWAKFKSECVSAFEDTPADMLQAKRVPESDVEVALTTSCNVFMNLVVMEGDGITERGAFHVLLPFVCNMLPEIDRRTKHLVFRGNLSVLGLLLLRRFVQQAKDHEHTIYRYLAASIRFLWDAFNVEDSSDGTSLVIAFSYRAIWDDIKELWYLGMQALSTVLPLLPWVAQFVVESGWAHQIMGTLWKVKQFGLEESVKMAYQDFLCGLLRCCRGSAEKLKESGALKVCKVHKMKELDILIRVHTDPTKPMST